MIISDIFMASKDEEDTFQNNETTRFQPIFLNNSQGISNEEDNEDIQGHTVRRSALPPQRLPNG